MKKVMRMLVAVGCVATLSACSTSNEKHFWQSDTDTPQSAQSMGLGDDSEFNVLGSSSLDENEIVSGQKVYFAYNTYVVEPSYEPVLAANAKYLLAHPAAAVRLEGHTDEVGSREYNIALGEHRANSVKEALIAKGVSGNQISTVSYGKEYPVATCVDAHKARCQLNRRTVIIYTELG